MAIKVERHQNKVGPIGVTMQRGNTRAADALINASNQISDLAFSDMVRVAKERGLDAGAAASVADIKTIDPETGVPVALKAPEGFGTAARSVYERVIDERFRQAVDDDIKLKAREFALKYQRSPNSVELYKQAMADYIGAMSEHADKSQWYHTYITESGAGFIASTAATLESHRQARQSRAAAATVNKGLQERSDMIFDHYRLYGLEGDSQVGPRSAGGGGSGSDSGVAEEMISLAREAESSGLLEPGASDTVIRNLFSERARGLIANQIPDMLPSERSQLASFVSSGGLSSLPSGRPDLQSALFGLDEDALSGISKWTRGVVKAMNEADSLNAASIRNRFDSDLLKDSVKVIADARQFGRASYGSADRVLPILQEYNQTLKDSASLIDVGDGDSKAMANSAVEVAKKKVVSWYSGVLTSAAADITDVATMDKVRLALLRGDSSGLPAPLASLVDVAQALDNDGFNGTSAAITKLEGMSSPLKSMASRESAQISEAKSKKLAALKRAASRKAAQVAEAKSKKLAATIEGAVSTIEGVEGLPSDEAAKVIAKAVGTLPTSQEIIGLASADAKTIIKEGVTGARSKAVAWFRNALASSVSAIRDRATLDNVITALEARDSSGLPSHLAQVVEAAKALDEAGFGTFDMAIAKYKGMIATVESIQSGDYADALAAAKETAANAGSMLQAMPPDEAVPLLNETIVSLPDILDPKDRASIVKGLRLSAAKSSLNQLIDLFPEISIREIQAVFRGIAPEGLPKEIVSYLKAAKKQAPGQEKGMVRHLEGMIATQRERLDAQANIERQSALASYILQGRAIPKADMKEAADLADKLMVSLIPKNPDGTPATLPDDFFYNPIYTSGLAYPGNPEMTYAEFYADVNNFIATNTQSVMPKGMAAMFNNVAVSGDVGSDGALLRAYELWKNVRTNIDPVWGTRSFSYSAQSDAVTDNARAFWDVVESTIDLHGTGAVGLGEVRRSLSNMKNADSEEAKRRFEMSLGGMKADEFVIDVIGDDAPISAVNTLTKYVIGFSGIGPDQNVLRERVQAAYERTWVEGAYPVLGPDGDPRTRASLEVKLGEHADKFAGYVEELTGRVFRTKNGFLDFFRGGAAAFKGEDTARFRPGVVTIGLVPNEAISDGNPQSYIVVEVYGDGMVPLMKDTEDGKVPIIVRTDDPAFLDSLRKDQVEVMLEAKESLLTLDIQRKINVIAAGGRADFKERRKGGGKTRDIDYRIFEMPNTLRHVDITTVEGRATFVDYMADLKAGGYDLRKYFRSDEEFAQFNKQIREGVE